jgi:DNA-binding MarR family transcriptional regulator
VDPTEWFEHLVRLETVLWNGVDSGLRRMCGLSLGAYDTLRLIHRTPGCRVQDVAREMAITVGGTSQAVDRLERDGYCRRVPNPTDRRSSLLELTDRGVAQLAEADEAVRGLLADLVGGVLSTRDEAAFGRHAATLRNAVATRLAVTPQHLPERNGGQ